MCLARAEGNVGGVGDDDEEDLGASLRADECRFVVVSGNRSAPETEAQSTS